MRGWIIGLVDEVNSKGKVVLGLGGVFNLGMSGDILNISDFLMFCFCVLFWALIVETVVVTAAGGGGGSSGLWSGTGMSAGAAPKMSSICLISQKRQ